MTHPLHSISKSFGINVCLVAAITTVGHAQMKGDSYVGTTSLTSQSEREIVRRQEDILVAEQFITAGDRALEEEKYEDAYVAYIDAVDLLGPGEATADRRASTLESFSKVALIYAHELVESGRYADAEMVAKTVLLPQYNPTYRPAIVFLSQLEQPDYYNKTITPQFAADRDEVAQLLVDAEGFFMTGRYDLAIKRYTQVLNVDKYNIAAQKGLERVANAKGDYYANAYNETRSRMLWEVTQGWELPRKKFQGGKDTLRDPTLTPGLSNEQITAKLNRIIIPQLDLRDTTISEAVEYLRQISRQLDTLEPDPDKKGVNIFLKVPSGSAAAATEGLLAVPDGDATIAATPTATEDTTVTLALSSVPLYEALRYLADLAGLKIKIDSVAVSIVPLTEVTEELVTKEYRVPPTFIPTAAAAAESAGIAAFSFNAGDSANANRIQGRQNAQIYLESQSVPFPPGASANYVASGSRLIVRNTQDNIDLIDRLVDAVQGAAPTQVEIEAKFVEINQNNLKELGFDWTLGPLQIGGTNSPIYGAGGTAGANPAAFPFVAPGGQTIGQNLVTSGLRSGTGSGPDSAVSINSLDSLLANVATGPAPALFGLSGIFTNPQFQVVIRALDQKKGIDLMSAPKVATKSGSKAVINIVREFRYPSEFDPPQIPQSTDADGIGARQSFVTSGVITPSTPTAFEIRNTGVTLDVTPVVGPDNYTIDLELAPEVVDFEGFINYGNPINGIDPGNALIGTGPGTRTITENVINQPVFSTRKVTTSVTIWDGMTVALGGLIREDVQKVEDKVPLLGDIPLVGRLFRSSIDQKIKKNLIIFVTAQLMDAEGKPLRSGEEEEEIVELLGVPDTIAPPVYQTKGTTYK